MSKTENLTFKTFLNKVLAGTAQGAIIALIPNAALAAILGYFDHIHAVNMIIQAAVIFQLATPTIMGSLIAKQFDLDPMQITITGGATFVGSGVIQFNAEAGAYIGAGTGDVINIMLTASIAILMLLFIGGKFGSSSIIGLPIVVGVGAGFLGMLTLPVATQATDFIGGMINTFTTNTIVVAAIPIAAAPAEIPFIPIAKLIPTVVIGEIINVA